MFINQLCENQLIQCNLSLIYQEYMPYSNDYHVSLCIDFQNSLFVNLLPIQAYFHSRIFFFNYPVCLKVFTVLLKACFQWPNHRIKINKNKHHLSKVFVNFIRAIIDTHTHILFQTLFRWYLYSRMFLLIFEFR